LKRRGTGRVRLRQFESTTQLISNTLDNVTEFLRNNGHAPVVGALDLLYMDTQGAN